MSAATDFLRQWVQRGVQDALSVTISSCQPPGNLAPGARNWSPGIAAYGFGINGVVLRDGSGSPNGVRFTDVLVAFSDRVSNPGASPPDYQRFNTGNKDRMALDFVIDGDVFG